LLVSVVTIEAGGWFMTSIAAGLVPMTQFQKSFARAGHGHVAVLVMLGLLGVCAGVTLPIWTGLSDELPGSA
jgi:hypothetical protein